MRCLLAAAGTVAVIMAITPTASADPNDVMSQAQRLFNGNQQTNMDAYRQGQQDEHMRQQAERERRRQDRQQQYGYGDRDPDYRYRSDPNRYSERNPYYRGY